MNARSKFILMAAHLDPSLLCTITFHSMLGCNIGAWLSAVCILMLHLGLMYAVWACYYWWEFPIYFHYTVGLVLKEVLPHWCQTWSVSSMRSSRSLQESASKSWSNFPCTVQQDHSASGPFSINHRTDYEEQHRVSGSLLLLQPEPGINAIPCQ